MTYSIAELQKIPEGDERVQMNYQWVDSNIYYKVDTAESKALLNHLALNLSNPITAAIPVMQSGEHIASSHKKAKQAIYANILEQPEEIKKSALWSALIPGTALYAILASLRHDFSHDHSHGGDIHKFKANYSSGCLAKIINELKAGPAPVEGSDIARALALPKCSELLATLRKQAPQTLPKSLQPHPPVVSYEQATASHKPIKPMTQERIQALEVDITNNL